MRDFKFGGERGGLQAQLISPFNLLRQPLVVVCKSQHHVLGELILHSLREGADLIGASAPEFGVVGRGPISGSLGQKRRPGCDGTHDRWGS